MPKQIRLPNAWTSAGIGLALLASAGTCGATDVRYDRATWQKEYHRPAEVPYPENNPYSDAKSNLGRMLFFEPLFSGSKTVSCGTCHNPTLSWGNGLPRAIGEKGNVLPLRAPTVLDIAWVPKPGWTGHFRDLENVAFGPILSPNNMNLSEKELIERLSAIPGYVKAFDTTFGGGEITRRKIELALATFQRGIVSSEAPFDRWINGNEGAIGDAAKRGFDLFNTKAHCASCHSGWTFTDSSFHDIGTAQGTDIGRGKLFPNSVKLQYAFKTPTLRDADRRAPYMHDGSVATLEQVIDLYDRGGIERPSRSERIFPLRLSGAEKADLIAFMRTLTGKPDTTPVPVLPR